MFVIQKDIFLITLTRDVSKWYDKWYKGNLKAVKTLHLRILLENYDPSRFRYCNNLNTERMLFLVEVQTMVDERLDSGGNEAWMF
jgi:hypothetical protein